MLKYKHILLATDLSEATDKIADAAVTMAKCSNATLSIIHVIEHTPIVYGSGEFSVPLDINLEEKLTENARRALDSLSNRLNIPEERRFVAHGSIKREIISYAQKLNIDLIIVGSHSHHGIQVLLGSAANAILHVAKCDVLSVRV